MEYYAKIHNQVLKKVVEKLNIDDGNKSTFVILDLYNAMVSTIDKFRQDAGISVHVFLTTQCFLYASQFSS
jgi:hypothetical protein